MKDREIETRMAMLETLKGLSRCTRGQQAACVIDPETNEPILDGYNGGPRGGKQLCGGGACTRDELQLVSGENSDVGCHHAERNVLANIAGRGGRGTRGMWLLVTGEPCLGCAKVIVQAGISTVVYARGGYGGHNGLWYMRENGVRVRPWPEGQP